MERQQIIATKSETDYIFNSLFHPNDGLIEMRSLPSKSRTFVEPDDMAAVQRFIEEHLHENQYFGLAARRNRSSGRAENCSFSRAIFADIDFKQIPEPEAIVALERFPLRTSFLVNSGGGFHAYWLLENPFDLQRHAKEFKALLRQTARALGADLASSEPARILRVPGTLNYKYNPPREVRLVY